MSEPVRRRSRTRAVLKVIGAVVVLLLFAYAVLAVAILVFGRIV